MTKFQDKSFSTYAPVNEEYSDNWERTFRRRTSEAQCTCALYPGPLGECPVHHPYSQHTCHEGSVCRATRGGCVLRTQHCNVFSGDHHYCMVAEGEDCCCTCDGCNAAFVRAADPCQDAYDAGYARGREMGTREGFAEGQASMEQRGEAAPPCTKTSGMGSAGMTSQVGPAPDTNTTPAGGPGEAGTNLRTSDAQPCEVCAGTCYCRRATGEARPDRQPCGHDWIDLAPICLRCNEADVLRRRSEDPTPACHPECSYCITWRDEHGGEPRAGAAMYVRVLSRKVDS